MSWSFEAGKPIYSQICEHIEIEIVNGRYLPGDKLPSVRDLADDAEVNPNTMQRALSELEAHGLVNTMGTSGRFVTDDRGLIEQTRADLVHSIVDEFKRRLVIIGIDGKTAMNLLTEEENKNG